jgi:hypothetical protein
MPSFCHLLSKTGPSDPGLRTEFPLSVLSSYSSVLIYGGEGGIRTHGTVSRTQHFQCCQFSHSCTSPHKDRTED